MYKKTRAYLRRFRVLKCLHHYFFVCLFFLRDFWKRIISIIKNVDGWVIYKNNEMGVCYFLDLNSYIDWLIFRDSVFEKYVIDCLRKELLTGKYSWFIDVGANIGQMSLYVARQFPDVSILAFEPCHASYIQHALNMRLNKLEYRLENCALSKKTGAIKFYIPKLEKGENLDKHNLGMVSAVFDKNRPLQTEVSCQAFAFDDYLKMKELLKGNRRGILFKIDVEGAELSVLEGMQKFLEQERGLRSICIVVELLFHRNRVSCEKTWNYLCGLGFTPFDMNGKDLFSFECEKIQTGRITDFVFKLGKKKQVC